MRDLYSDLRALKLPGMAKAYRELKNRPGVENLNFEEKLTLLIEAEIDNKSANKIKVLLKNAKFSEPTADICEIKYFPGRVIDREKINELATNDFVRKHSNVILAGACGSGKTYIANAIGVNACLHKIETRYIRLPNLIDDFLIASAISVEEGRKYIAKFAKYELLIIDEWLIYSEYSEIEVRFLLELMELRQKKANVLCSQRHTKGWRDILGKDIKSEALVDRLIGGAIKLEINSEESLRGKDF